MVSIRASRALVKASSSVRPSSNTVCQEHPFLVNKASARLTPIPGTPLYPSVESPAIDCVRCQAAPSSGLTVNTLSRLYSLPGICLMSLSGDTIILPGFWVAYTPIASSASN